MRAWHCEAHAAAREGTARVDEPGAQRAAARQGGIDARARAAGLHTKRLHRPPPALFGRARPILVEGAHAVRGEDDGNLARVDVLLPPVRLVD
eukprot:scaffold4116_cov106-Isochrysis_galbana.AAC.3